MGGGGSTFYIGGRAGEVEIKDVSLLTELVMGPGWGPGVFQQEVLGCSRLECCLSWSIEVGATRVLFGTVLGQSHCNGPYRMKLGAR